MADEFPIDREVRHGDPLSPKLFTALMNEVFREAYIPERINIGGENLTSSRFADDVALLNRKGKQMKKQTLKQSELKHLKVGPKIHKGKTKCMTNHADNVKVVEGMILLDQ